jgi:hypothetical protein
VEPPFIIAESVGHMAEIKSSLEIALERAAAMGGEAGGGAAIAEAASQGKVLARKVLNGSLPAHSLMQDINKMGGPAQPHARLAAADQLLDKLPQAWFLAGPALEMLAAKVDAQDLVSQLGRVIGELEQAVRLTENALSSELAKLCSGEGISGSALVPNPRACDHYEERIKQAMAGPQKELNRLRAELMQRFEVESG